METKSPQPADDSKPPKNKTASDKVLDFGAYVLQKFKRFSTINEDDHFMMVVVKVLLRMVGILILLILSPFIITALIISFLLAG